MSRFPQCLNEGHVPVKALEITNGISACRRLVLGRLGTVGQPRGGTSAAGARQALKERRRRTNGDTQGKRRECARRGMQDGYKWSSAAMLQSPGRRPKSERPQKNTRTSTPMRGEHGQYRTRGVREISDLSNARGQAKRGRQVQPVAFRETERTQKAYPKGEKGVLEQFHPRRGTQRCIESGDVHGTKARGQGKRPIYRRGRNKGNNPARATAHAY